MHEIKVFNIDLNKWYPYLESAKEVRIVPLADVHIGDELLDEKKLKETIAYIKDTPNVFTVLNGDMMNTAIKSSVSDVYQEKLTPMQQIDALVTLLEPIKHKVLAATSGNHEDRVKRETSIDIMHIAMKEMGIGERYSSLPFYLYLYFGAKGRGRKAPMCYTIAAYHGSGGGRKIGGKVNRLLEMSEIFIADVFIMSHVHVPVGTKRCVLVPDYGNKALTCKEMLYVISNSFLKYGGYGAKLGFNPASTSRVEVVLDGTKRSTRVTL